MGISGSGRASLERQLYLEKSRIQASSGNTALAGGQRTAKNYKYNLQVAAQTKYVVTNRRETLITTFLVIQMFSAFCTKGKGQICEICPRKGGTNLICTNGYYRNRTYQCRLTLPTQGYPPPYFLGRLFTTLTQLQQLYQIQKTKFSLCLCLWLLCLL